MFPPDGTTTGRIIAEIAEFFSQDRDVQVLTGPSVGLGEVDKQPFEVKRVQSALVQDRGIRYRIRSSIAIANELTSLCQRVAKADDVILSVTNPFNLPLRLSQKAKNARHVILVHDLYPEVLAATNVVSSRHLFYKFLDGMTAKSFAKASAIVVLGRDTQEVLSRKWPQLAHKLHVVTNWADLDLFDPHAVPASEPFVFQYAGNMGRTHDPAALVRAYDLIENPTFQIELIGHGEQRKLLESDLETNPRSGISLRDFVPIEQFPRSLSDANVSVISYGSGMTGVSVPSRMYNIMAAARPILGICEASSELGRTITENGIGWIAPPGDAESLAQLMVQIAAQQEQAAEKGHQARQLAETQYSKQLCLEKLRSVVNQVTS